MYGDPVVVHTLSSGSVDWGDNGTQTLPGDAASATHTYATGTDAGTSQRYTATATATDPSGATGVATFAVTVLPGCRPPRRWDPVKRRRHYGNRRWRRHDPGPAIWPAVATGGRLDLGFRPQRGQRRFALRAELAHHGFERQRHHVVERHVGRWDGAAGDFGRTDLRESYVQHHRPVRDSATATLVGGSQEETSSAAGSLDGNFANGGIAQATGGGGSPSVAVNPNGDLAVLTLAYSGS